MNNVTSKNKRIARNTLFLYFRMLLIMLVSLYTVQVVISTLGVVDYGIYSAVGGIVMIMAFLSQTISSAAQRFFSYELGKGNIEHLQKIFSSILIIFFILGLIIVVIAETVGLWMLYNKMVIPIERMNAAFWVFQFSLLTFLITIISTPYSAIIVAHEDMKIFAYVSVLEAILKLVIVYLLLLFSFDHLILYAILLFAVSCLVRGIYSLICSARYPETKFVFIWDKDIFKSIFSYSSWTLFGTIAGTANSQGVNILLNMFFGPVANAAQSVGHQVSVALQTFSGGIFTAIRPPLIKSYADGDYDYMMSLFYKSSRYSFLLLYIILFPLVVKMNFVLSVWLGVVGEYMVEFSRLMMIYVVLIAIGTPITIIMQAANKVMLYHGVVDGFALICLPVSYICFKLFSLPASTVFIVMIVVFAIAHCIRLSLMRRFVALSYFDYLQKFISPVIGVVLFSSILGYAYSEIIGYDNSFVGGFIDLIVLVVIALFSVLLIGVKNAECIKILNFVLRRND